MRELVSLADEAGQNVKNITYWPLDKKLAKFNKVLLLEAYLLFLTCGDEIAMLI